MQGRASVTGVQAATSGLHVPGKEDRFRDLWCTGSTGEQQECPPGKGHCSAWRRHAAVILNLDQLQALKVQIPQLDAHGSSSRLHPPPCFMCVLPILHPSSNTQKTLPPGSPLASLVTPSKVPSAHNVYLALSVAVPIHCSVSSESLHLRWVLFFFVRPSLRLLSSSLGVGGRGTPAE